MLGEAFAYLLDGRSWTDRGLGEQLVQQLALTASAMVVAVLLGLPLALWLGHLGRGGTVAINVSNIGRAVPVFAVLVILSVGPLGTDTFGPLGRAGLATLVALVLFALPPIITNAYVAMREVDRDIVDAARGTGMSEWEVFRRVELPLALPVTLTGVRLALVQVWATATVAALVAGPGLGNTVTLGFANNRFDQVLAGSILVAGAALLLEAVAVLVQRATDPMRRATRGDRTSRRHASVSPL